MKKPAVIAESKLPSGTPANGLARRSLGALKWNYLGAVVRMLSQLVIGIVLARQLGPEPFGLIAIASLIIGLGNLVADTGLGVALIQREQVSPRDVRYVFTLQLLAGLTLALLAVFAAPLIAAFFGRADAAPVLRWMSLIFVFQAIGQTASALLRRDLNHKRLQILQIVSYLAGYLLVGMPLAFSGQGVWALVSAQLAQSAINAIAVYMSTRHPLMPVFSADQSGLFKFGSKVLASNLTSWGISNLDSAIIGRMLGVVNLGIYNRSMNLIASPMNAVVSTLQGVLLPLYSRLQSRAEAVRDTYLASICVMSVVLAPAFAAVAAMPETTILAVYGQEWRAAIVLITPLALAMPVNAVLAMGGPMMLGMGRAGMDAASQAIGVVVMVLAVIVASRFSLLAVAWVVLAVYLLRAWLVTHVAAGLIAVPARALFRALIGPLMLAALAGLLAWQADYWFAVVAPQPGLRFVLVLFAVALIVLLAIMMWGRWIFCPEAKNIMLNARPHLDPRLGNLMMCWSVA